MKLVFLADAGSNHTVRWVRYFAENGHEVHLVSERPYRGNVAEGVKLHLLESRGPRFPLISSAAKHFSNVSRIKSLLKKIEPDVLHAHYAIGFGFWGAQARFHPFVLTVWGSDILVEPQKSRIARWMVNTVLRKADLVTCDAEHMQEALVKMGMPPERIELLYFGTDTEKFHPRQKDAKLAEQLGAKGSPLILSARSLEPVYDIQSLIRAAPAVLKEFPNARFVLAGSGSQEAELKALAGTLGVSDRVIFAGRLSQDDLARYMASAAIYVSTSLSDAGLGSSTSEAMASGVPVIITDFGDNRKWVEDGVSGVIIPLRDPETLAAKIINLLNNPEIGRRFGSAGRSIIEERNSYKRQMGKMGELYRELVESRRK